MEGMYRIPLNGSLKVLDASPGSWPPASAPRCASPRLWVLLSGHYRSFWFTQHTIEAVADRTSDGCFFIAAFFPEKLDAETRRRPTRSSGPKGGNADSWLNLSISGGFRSSTRKEDVASTDLLRASPLKCLAFASVRRFGSLDRFGAASLALGWYGAWAVAQWAADVHGIKPRDDSVVVRIRPDVPIVPFSIDSFQWALNNVPGRGRHLVIGGGGQQAFPTGHPRRDQLQGDLYMMTSWYCYTHDIALPNQVYRGTGRTPSPSLNAALGWMFMQNGWQRVGDLNDPAALRAGCVCLDGGLECEAESCKVTVVTADFVTSSRALIRIKDIAQLPNLRHIQTAERVNVSTGVYPYCQARTVLETGNRDAPGNFTLIMHKARLIAYLVGLKAVNLLALTERELRQWALCPPGFEAEPRDFARVRIG